MKKILIGIILVLGSFVVYAQTPEEKAAEDLRIQQRIEAFNLEFGEKVYDIEDALSMQELWEDIKALDEKIAFEKDKEVLKVTHDLYRKDFNLYLEYLKTNPELLFEKGDYYFRMNRYHKAHEVFAKDETNVKNLYGAAVTARFLNDNLKSLKYYNMLLNLDPNFYEGYLGRGIINRNIGNYDGAISDFNHYKKYNDSESVYLGLGDTYMASNRYDEARNILEEGRNKYPKSKIIRRMLKKIYTKVN